MSEFITVLASIACVFLVGISITSTHTLNITPNRIRVSIWVGLTAFTFLALAANFFAPMRSTIARYTLTSIVLLAFLVLLLRVSRTRKAGNKIHSSGWKKPSWQILLLLVAFVVVSIWWFAASSKAPTNYDSGLYHIQAIWYSADFRALPGLANLYPGYGFSNSFNPLTAWLTNGPMGMNSYKLINGIFFCLLAFELTLRTLSAARNAAGTKILLIATAVFVAPMVWMVDYWVISPTFDTPVAILTFVSFAALADLLLAKTPKRSSALIVLLPAALAATMRPHYWLLFTFAAFIAVWKITRKPAPEAFKAYLWGVATSLVLALTMIFRDVILSGWIFYPFRFLAANVEWVAPDPSPLMRATQLWARAPNSDYQKLGDGWEWVQPWLFDSLTSWVGAGVIGCLILATLLWIAARSKFQIKSLLILLSPLIVFLATWFLIGAPQLRYVWAPLLLVGILPLVWSWIAVDSKYGLKARTRNLVGLLVGVQLLGVVAISAALVLPQLPTELPAVSVNETPLESISGKSVYNLMIPRESDQCWEKYPLCSPAAAAGLKLRGNSIADGFIHSTNAH